MVKLYGVLPDGVHFVYMQSQQKTTTHKQKIERRVGGWGKGVVPLHIVKQM